MSYECCGCLSLTMSLFMRCMCSVCVCIIVYDLAALLSEQEFFRRKVSYQGSFIEHQNQRTALDYRRFFDKFPLS